MNPGVLLLDGGGGGGGSFEALALLARALATRGFRPAAAFFNPVAQAADLERAGIPVAVVDHPWLSRRPGGPKPTARLHPRLARAWPGLAFALEQRASRACLARLEAFARSHGTDLVHGNTSPLQDAPALWLGARLGAPVVLHLRAWPPRRPFPPALRLARRRAAAILSVGDALAAAWAAAGLNADRIETVRDGIEPAVEAPAPWPEERLRGHPHFVAAVRLVRWKNAGLLLDALHLVRREAPEARLTLFGDGPERPALEAQAGRLGLSGAVDFAGHVPRVRSQFPLFDALVLPSLREPGALVLFEAMACGLPCVALASGGNAEVLDQGRCGLLVPPQDPAALAAAMLRAARDPALRESLAAAGRARIAGPLHIDRHGDAVAAVYRRVRATSQ